VKTLAAFRPTLFRSSFPALALAAAAFIASAPAQDRLTETPVFIQQGFGPGGTDLPADGSVQCVTTAMSMNLSYLANTGFTQLLTPNASFAEQLNLVRVMCGLCGTTNLGGTYTSGLLQGVETYLAAKGISNYTLDSIPSDGTPGHAAADVQWFQDQLANPETVALLSVGWFTQNTHTGVITNSGGHGMAVVAADASTGYLTIHNPAPSSLLKVPDVTAQGPQTLHTIPFTGSDPTDLPYPPYIQYDPAQPGSTLGPEPGHPDILSLAVIWNGVALHLDPSQKPSAGWTPATWLLSSTTRTLNTYGGDLTVEAPIGISNFGIIKQGVGTVLLTRDNQSTGTNQIDNGTLRSNFAGATPFGFGNFTIGAGEVSLTPQTTTPTALNIGLATGFGSSLTVQRHGVISFDAGTNPSLAVTVGDAAANAGSNLTVAPHAALTLAPGHGLAGLGTTERFFVAGNGVLPSAGGILAPNIVARDNDAAGSGTFLQVGAGNELLAATYTESTTTPIASVGAGAIYDVTDTQTIAPGATATVAALRVSGATIGGGAASTLAVGPNVANQGAGIILNQGVLDAPTLDFGASDGVIYASRGVNATSPGGSVHSVITGSGALTTYGPGILELTGANTYTGPTYVQSGTLRAANSTGSATGLGDVNIAATGTLEVAGSTGRVQGKVSVTDGTLALTGGTIGGNVTLGVRGTLGGAGTIEGNLTADGVIGAGPQTGTLTLKGSVTLTGNSVWQWRLDHLVDDTTGQAGVDWNTLAFAPGSGALITMEAFSLTGDFSHVNPDGGETFWTQPHHWTIMTSTVDLFTTVNGFNDSWGFTQFQSGSFTWTGENSGTSIVLNFAPAAVPEPATVALLALAGTAAIPALRRRLKTAI